MLTTAFKETELTHKKPDGKTGDIMIVTIAQKRAMTITLFQSGGHLLVLDLKKERKKGKSSRGPFCKIAMDDDLTSDNYISPERP
jgi:hypothetical protein